MLTNSFFLTKTCLFCFFKKTNLFLTKIMPGSSFFAHQTLVPHFLKHEMTTILPKTMKVNTCERKLRAKVHQIEYQTNELTNRKKNRRIQFRAQCFKKLRLITSPATPIFRLGYFHQLICKYATKKHVIRRHHFTKILIPNFETFRTKLVVRREIAQVFLASLF